MSPQRKTLPQLTPKCRYWVQYRLASPRTYPIAGSWQETATWKFSQKDFGALHMSEIVL